MNNNILVVDSGFGGISTLAEMRLQMPKTNFLYYADDGFMPYGNKTSEQIFEHLFEIVSRFENEICGLVLACNTATGVAIDGLRKVFEFPIVGTEPAIVPACDGEHAVLALVTPLEAKQNKLRRLVCGRRVFVLPEPNLASQIEKHFCELKSVGDLNENPKVNDIVSNVKSRAALLGEPNIVLGCTHYVFLKHTNLFDDYHLFDGNAGVAKRTFCLFGDCGLGKTQFIFGSGDKKKPQIALRLLKETIELLREV